MIGPDHALRPLERARTPRDLFGDDPDEAARTCRRPARMLRPDATGGRTADRFVRLTAPWSARTGADPAVIAARRRSYRLGGKIAEGDLPTSMRSGARTARWSSRCPAIPPTAT
ncbi:hypothetical protein [Thermomonospora catenispora]|uniref:hypothetical protein n=1 Tax=Thermomonospora catenispora TaxID=2493090 RepID=UPI001F4F16C4|nr:hypothetical protein [Thermomonospora catenispora]